METSIETNSDEMGFLVPGSTIEVKHIVNFYEEGLVRGQIQHCSGDRGWITLQNLNSGSLHVFPYKDLVIFALLTDPL